MSLVNRVDRSIIYTIGPIGPARTIVALDMSATEQILRELVDIMPSVASLELVKRHPGFVEAAQRQLDKSGDYTPEIPRCICHDVIPKGPNIPLTTCHLCGREI